ncbi:DUF2066 domain-containing protein [Cognatilysobacter terrigena]|uniref:DUF2066 domain-containing protein n=1 Tax=Cognatilysobacter terrigena TaxID=2488749 RepID=UPI00106196DA|nr:DUF2066 domain-containing protein [Lysobacter terrigena]
MARTYRLLTVFLFLAAFSTAVFAQRVEGDRARASGAYATEVVVTNQSDAQRNTGFARGLLQVLQRMTGDRAINQRPGVGDELRNAKAYVDHYDYRQDEGVSATGAPSFNTTLVVQYDAKKVDEMIATLGLPMWPQPRPKPVLWLAIDDGSGPRLVGLDKANAARPVLDRAKQRGYALGLPAGNAAEQALVGSIWRGDAAAISRASAKYAPPMQLIGKMYRAIAGGWQVEWTFLDNGKQLAKSSTYDRDARRAMSGGADIAADALIRKYAKPGKALGPAGTYTITFTGVNSTDDFIRLAAYLEKVAVVKRATPVRATPEGLTYELELVSGVAGFSRIATRDGVVEAVGDGDDSTTTFHLR